MEFEFCTPIPYSEPLPITLAAHSGSLLERTIIDLGDTVLARMKADRAIELASRQNPLSSTDELCHTFCDCIKNQCSSPKQKTIHVEYDNIAASSYNYDKKPMK